MRSPCRGRRQNKQARPLSQMPATPRLGLSATVGKPQQETWKVVSVPGQVDRVALRVIAERHPAAPQDLDNLFRLLVERHAAEVARAASLERDSRHRGEPAGLDIAEESTSPG